MAPPTFGDLGKQSRDVFGKGYNFGVIKLDVKTKTESGIEFKSSGNSGIDSGKVSGNLETKYKVKDLGLTFTEKWTTDNTLATTLDVEDQLAKGLKLTLDTNFAPNTGAKSGKLAAEFTQEAATLEADVDLALSAVNASATVGYNSWLAGYQTTFDIAKSAITKNNFGIGYTAPDFVLHTSVNNGSDFGGSIYHKVNGNLEAGVSLGWSSSTSNTNFAIGSKYVLDADSSIRAKVNNKCEVGLGYQQKLRDGITVTLSALVNGGALQQGGHKVGCALEFSS